VRVLLTGAGGQLGRELQRSAPQGCELHAFARADLDVTDADAVQAAIDRVEPDGILKASAYTRVDAAEEEAEAAYAVNETGAANLARAAAQAGARLVYVSTDYVFDGASPRPYGPDAAPNPLNVYGASKLAGERAVQRILPEASLILRTSWLYSAYGANFVMSILGLLRERERLDVVCDEIASPTWARGLAETIWRCAGDPGLTGILHWCDAGIASRYDFAVAIAEEAGARGLGVRTGDIRPVRSNRQTAVSRPAFSGLDPASGARASGRRLQHWRAALREMLDELGAQADA